MFENSTKESGEHEYYTSLELFKQLSDENQLQLKNSADNLMRKKKLEALVAKRRHNLAYLKKVHQGDNFWLNIASISKLQLQSLFASHVPQSRTLSYYYLGLSVANLLDIGAGVLFVNACTQLMEEWEYHIAGNTMQGMRYLMSKSSAQTYPQTIALSSLDAADNCTLSSSTALGKLRQQPEYRAPALHKFNNSVVFEVLHCPPQAFPLDHAEVVISLCDVLSQLYEKLMHEDCFRQQSVFDAVVKLDTKMKHHLINLASKEFTDWSAIMVNNQLVAQLGFGK